MSDEYSCWICKQIKPRPATYEATALNGMRFEYCPMCWSGKTTRKMKSPEEWLTETCHCPNGKRVMNKTITKEWISSVQEDACFDLRQQLAESEKRVAGLIAVLKEDALWGWDKNCPVEVATTYASGGSLTLGPNNCRAFFEKRKLALAMGEQTR